jgi:hypothetical protein
MRNSRSEKLDAKLRRPRSDAKRRSVTPSVRIPTVRRTRTRREGMRRGNVPEVFTLVPPPLTCDRR